MVSGLSQLECRHFHHARIFDELAQQDFDVFPVQRRVLEGNRKLDQQRGELSRRSEGAEAFPRQAFVFVVRLDGSSGSGLHGGQPGMSERTVQFGSEHKLGVHRAHFARPELGQFRLDMAVERGINFHHVEGPRQHFQGVHLLARHFRRIENSFPVFI